jgi:hypothetical protein
MNYKQAKNNGLGGELKPRKPLASEMIDDLTHSACAGMCVHLKRRAHVRMAGSSLSHFQSNHSANRLKRAAIASQS